MNLTSTFLKILHQNTNNPISPSPCAWLNHRIASINHYVIQRAHETRSLEPEYRIKTASGKHSRILEFNAKHPQIPNANTSPQYLTRTCTNRIQDDNIENTFIFACFQQNDGFDPFTHHNTAFLYWTASHSHWQTVIVLVKNNINILVSHPMRQQSESPLRAEFSGSIVGNHPNHEAEINFTFLSLSTKCSQHWPVNKFQNHLFACEQFISRNMESSASSLIQELKSFQEQFRNAVHHFLWAAEPSFRSLDERLTNCLLQINQFKEFAAVEAAREQPREDTEEMNLKKTNLGFAYETTHRMGNAETNCNKRGRQASHV